VESGVKHHQTNRQTTSEVTIPIKQTDTQEIICMQQVLVVIAEF